MALFSIPIFLFIESLHWETNLQIRSRMENAKKNMDHDNDGIFGCIKGCCKKADSMAPLQALLLSKTLEDGGIVEKITDESELKFVGKEATAKADGLLACQ